jgi:hypothetical protein
MMNNSGPRERMRWGILQEGYQPISPRDPQANDEPPRRQPPRGGTAVVDAPVARVLPASPRVNGQR